MLYSVFTTIAFNLIFIIWITGHHLVLIFRKYCVNRCKAKKDKNYDVVYEGEPLSNEQFAEKKEKQVTAFA